MISIVIPAFNEEAVIARCLRGLTAGAAPGEIEVIVACNGCRDRTATIAREFGPPVRVVETSRASKIAALNLGDQAARGFPRCFVDADVEITIEDVRRVAALLAEGRVHAAAPGLRVDLTRSSWAVKAFYAIWLRRPYHRAGTIGSGFYAVSETGRARFTQFPEIIADDAYMRALFRPDERGAVPGAQFTIRAPKTLRDLIKIKTRSRLGLYELYRKFPDLPGYRDRSREAPLTEADRAIPSRSILHREPWLAHPSLWPCTLVYLFVNLVTRLRAQRQRATLGAYRWERDNSSRQLEPDNTGASQKASFPL